MALERAGFFKELRHGDPAGPSLVACRATLAAGDRSRIATYLRAGTILAATGSLVGDWFEPTRAPSIELALLTDGAWVWPSDLAHYVEAHGVCVPDALVEHMRAQRWTARPLAPAELLELEEQLLGNAAG